MFVMAGEQGFEPWLAESESAVLPLDDSPKNHRRIIQQLGYCVCFLLVKMKEFFKSSAFFSYLFFESLLFFLALFLRIENSLTLLVQSIDSACALIAT